MCKLSASPWLLLQLVKLNVDAEHIMIWIYYSRSTVLWVNAVCHCVYCHARLLLLHQHLTTHHNI